MATRVEVRKVEQITIPQWLALPLPLRNKFSEKFNIKRSGYTHVEDNRVVTDGHTHGDLAVVNTNTLQELTGEKTKVFSELLQAAIDLLDGKPVGHKKDEGEQSDDTGRDGQSSPKAKV